jgi:RHH-type rel operon transcriptional repressor/antitoxin RelB
MSTALSFRIPDLLAKQLNSVSKETERPRAFIIQKALESYMQSYADMQIAIDRLQDQTDPIISSKELKKSLGL